MESTDKANKPGGGAAQFHFNFTGAGASDLENAKSAETKANSKFEFSFQSPKEMVEKSLNTQPTPTKPTVMDATESQRRKAEPTPDVALAPTPKSLPTVATDHAALPTTPLLALTPETPQEPPGGRLSELLGKIRSGSRYVAPRPSPQQSVPAVRPPGERTSRMESILERLKTLEKETGSESSKPPGSDNQEQEAISLPTVKEIQAYLKDGPEDALMQANDEVQKAAHLFGDRMSTLQSDFEILNDKIDDLIVAAARQAAELFFAADPALIDDIQELSDKIEEAKPPVAKMV